MLELIFIFGVWINPAAIAYLDNGVNSGCVITYMGDQYKRDKFDQSCDELAIAINSALKKQRHD